MADNGSAAKTLLIGLNADHFRHPLDRQATQTLKQLPGLDVAIRSLLGPMGEQFFYLENIAASVLVGPTQLPNIYGLLVEACRVLDLEVPQLYIKQHPVPNAYTFAMRGKQPFVVEQKSKNELLNEAELQAVNGHGVGEMCRIYVRSRCPFGHARCPYRCLCFNEAIWWRSYPFSAAQPGCFYRTGQLIRRYQRDRDGRNAKAPQDG